MKFLFLQPPHPGTCFVNVCHAAACNLVRCTCPPRDLFAVKLQGPTQPVDSGVAAVEAYFPASTFQFCFIQLQLFGGLHLKISLRTHCRHISTTKIPLRAVARQRNWHARKLDPQNIFLTHAPRTFLQSARAAQYNAF